jgi:hypothetical protein
MIDRYGLDLAGLALDMTNFATYIDSANERAPIAQRGKAKQKRVDLRLVGLALVVTRDGGIPIVSHAYPGDRPDVTQFSAVLDELVTRYRLLVDSVESLTVVYDAGQNSGDNHAAVEASGIGFVGSLPPSDHPGLLDISRDRYRVVDADRFEGLTAYDTTVTALGVTRRAVLTHSPTLHAGQSRGLDQTLAKARARLAELRARLHRGNTRRPRQAVEADIAAILKPRWVAQIITVTLTGEDPASFRLSWRTSTRVRHRLEERLFGKRILFTNRRHLARHRRRGGLPIPVRRGIRVPATQGPPRRVLQPHAPLDRLQDPRPCLHLRARPRRRAPHAPPRRPGRTTPIRPRATRPPRRHRRNRPATPQRR